MTERQLHLFRSKRQRGTKAPAPSELQIHCMVIDDLRRWATPGWLYVHYPSGELRTAVTAAKLQRMGVFAGITDLMLFPPRDAGEPRCHFLELKRPGGKLNLAQYGFKLWCEKHGYPHAVAHSYRDAVSILKNWGVLQSGVHER